MPIFRKQKSNDASERTNESAGLTLRGIDLDLLRESMHGTGRYVWLTRNDVHEVGFVLLESDNRIAELSRGRDLERAHFRSAVLTVNGVRILVSLILLDDQVAEWWWNAHNSHMRPLLEHLQRQEQISIALVSRDGTVRTAGRFPWDSSGVVAALGAIDEVPPWNDVAFDAARAAIEVSYPTPVALWSALGPR